MQFEFKIIASIRFVLIFLGLQFAWIVHAQNLSKLTPDTLWMEEMTWMELQHHTANGFKSVILPTGGIEQNGPFIALGKHNKVI